MRAACALSAATVLILLAGAIPAQASGGAHLVKDIRPGTAGSSAAFNRRPATGAGTLRRWGAAMSVSEGGCACGEVRYRLTADPLIVHCCHCLNCQRQTGSAFVINLVIEADCVELLAGNPQCVDVPRDEGVQPIYRCPTCQVALFSEYNRPWLRFVRAGTLDDPSTVTPDVHIFTRSKLDWVTLPEPTPAFEAFYDPQAVWPQASLERMAAHGGS